jgi:hypothetical protein
VSEHFAAMLAILLFEMFVVIVGLVTGLGLVVALVAAAGAGASAAEVALRLLGGRGGGTPGNGLSGGPDLGLGAPDSRPGPVRRILSKRVRQIRNA